VASLIVIGGGCYGHLHATRLLTANRRGQIAFDRVVIVDREETHKARRAIGDRPDVRYVAADWDAFLREYLADPDATADDHLVPAPLAPHLLANWLLAALQADLPTRSVRWETVTHTVDQPYARHGRDGAFYVSFADWICPVECTEPAICPAIRSPRTWEQAAFLRERLGGDPAVADLAIFVCRLLTGGIGTVPVAELHAARARFRALAEARPDTPLTCLVATVSACHGAIAQLAIGAAASDDALASPGVTP
jgi:hypothetical protein